jgi:hypothetical protein
MELSRILPSLIRFLIVVGAIVAIVYGVMVTLVAYVTPQPRQMTCDPGAAVEQVRLSFVTPVNDAGS